jgi:transposase-like protein
VVRFGHSAGQQRFRCKVCGKTFIALTGTPMQRLRERDTWVASAECLSRGMTIRASTEAVGLTVDRSFRWRHQFLAYLAEQRPTGLTGLLEADQTVFRRS